MKNQNFILNEIIEDLVETRTSLLRPLIKLNYFGLLTKNEELIEFTTNEIKGYRNPNTEVPNYRRTIAKLEVTLQSHIHTHTKEVPNEFLQEPFRSQLKYTVVNDGIEIIENYITKNSNNQNQDAFFYTPLPISICPILQPIVENLYKSNAKVYAVGAKLVGNGNLILGIPSVVRTNLLELVLKISEKFGYVIEINSFNKSKENNNTINHYMNTIINNTGDGNIVNTGDNSSINADINVTKGDFDSLKTKLQDQGIDSNDIDDLKEILDKNLKPNENQLSEDTNNWILKIIGKSLKGVGKIATGISANILATLIKQYYGIE